MILATCLTQINYTTTEATKTCPHDLVLHILVLHILHLYLQYIVLLTININVRKEFYGEKKCLNIHFTIFKCIALMSNPEKTVAWQISLR